MGIHSDGSVKRSRLRKICVPLSEDTVTRAEGIKLADGRPVSRSLALRVATAIGLDAIEADPSRLVAYTPRPAA